MIDERASKRIEINKSLYDQARNYCDCNSIRFRDLIEDSIENAIEQEEQLKAISEAKDIMNHLNIEREKFYNYGFRQGICAAILLFQGKIGTSLSIQAKSPNLVDSFFKPVTGPQLDIFSTNNNL